ncbi:uncharacterized protein LOC106458290 isoform X2 [Limulus polyphemus]|uniref:Uncharacterized protein LOC106458290 isoform X2 n=1 Tax=Limulus polyphemus TaxID=6850 RepID=A0ABM1S970_LIMPO|nr:uncharacterized protein LOC106458290 isoform X2 [Limulus polyphemus]
MFWRLYFFICTNTAKKKQGLLLWLLWACADRSYGASLGYHDATGLYGYASDTYASEVQEVPQPYDFGYQVKDDYGNSQSRQEAGDDYGNKVGSYSYRDAYGIYRKVEYVADADGFRAKIKTNEPGTSNDSPADVSIVAEEPVATYQTTAQDISESRPYQYDSFPVVVNPYASVRRSYITRIRPTQLDHPQEPIYTIAQDVPYTPETGVVFPNSVAVPDGHHVLRPVHTTGSNNIFIQTPQYFPNVAGQEQVFESRLYEKPLQTFEPDYGSKYNDLNVYAAEIQERKTKLPTYQDK